MSTYDALDRVTLKSYTGVSTPAVTYCYDGQVAGTTDGSCVAGSAAYSVGRLTQVSSSVSSTSYTGYDALGRVTGSVQKTGTPSFPFTYQYDLAGDLTQEAYPSGRTILNGYDSAGRLCSVSGTTGTPPAPPYACGGSGTGTTVYASAAQYAPHGALQSVARGDGLAETWAYNARLQPVQVNAGSAFGLNLYYCPGKAVSCATNNGNVLTESVTAPGLSVLDENIGYAAVNRLTSFAEGGNSQNYGYDFAGNRWWTQNTGSLTLSSLLPGSGSGYNANNQLTGNGAAYSDGRGNLTGIAAYGFGYDAENRMTSSVLSGSTVSYGYDGDGRRVTKTAGSQVTTFVYDAAGQMVGEYGDPTPAPPCAPCFVTVDQLGSTRMLTDGQGNVKERHDYMPFGDELVAGIGGRTTAQGYLNGGDPEGVPALFTGQYRDAETQSSAMSSGLDYFGARYFAGALGRFTSPDGPLEDQHVVDPQSWNLYSYVRNNPLRYTAPDGRDCFQGFASCADFLIGGAKGLINAGTSGLMNSPTTLTNALISPFRSYQFPTVFAPPTQASNSDQQQGIESMNGALLASPLGELGAAEEAPAIANSVSTITQNAAQGRAFQNDVAVAKSLTDTDVVQNVSVRTQSGVCTQIDVVSTNSSGNVALTEAKSSATARLTSAQAAAHPEIAQTGATVIGKGKAPYIGGTKIPPTQVQVVRPNCPEAGCSQ